MNILYTAFSIRKGLGGHLRSLKQIKEEVSKYHRCYTIIFGQIESPIFIDDKTSIFINIKTFSFYSIRKKINKYLILNEIDIIHAFDKHSYKLIQLGKNLPKLLTLCGGPNPKHYPYAKHLTCFSLENYNYFSKLSIFKNSSLTLIPNRVKKFESNYSLIQELERKIGKKPKDIILLRITRIGNEYKKSINQSINLLRLLQSSNENNNFKLLIIGSVYDKITYRAIRNETKNIQNLFFITDDKFTKESKLLIDIADIVIGTGRGLMEASSKGKILFSPVANSNLPALIDKSNFNDFFYYNFSERTIVSHENREEIIVNKILNENSELSKFSHEIFEMHFKLENGIDLYLKKYKEISSTKGEKTKLFSLIIHLMHAKYLVIKNKIV